MRPTRGPLITLCLALLTVAAAAAALLAHWHPRLTAGWPVLRVALTLAAVLAIWLISRVIDRVSDGLHTPRHRWQKRVRDLMHLQADERFREVDLFAGLLHVTLWLGLLLLLLRVWGLSKESFDILRQLAWTGFPVGDIKIVPAQLLVGALLLVLVTAIIRWFTNRLENHWLARTPMEAHVREAISTITGYVLFLIAALALASYAGLDLSKLALIAGALSVGIGFGLQTIVNNFVSGLILLFEQPIRRGNFISVGNTEGFVRRIRIRGTELETLDRITVIVPNSSMLAGEVQNWNLRDRFGRIICKVGVAYGSDVRLVERLLIEVAAKHREVINDAAAGVPRPQALFMAFGDSTLDFELRCFIHDVTRRYQVVSDLNFAIDAAFRAHDVTIAFPQLDIWHRSAPPRQDPEAGRNP